jgi:uncharacterized membrane protein YidH (DUF202 family)
MIFALNVASAVLALVAATLTYWASIPFTDSRWNETTLDERRHRKRRSLLMWFMFASVIAVAAMQIYVATKVP